MWILQLSLIAHMPSIFSRIVSGEIPCHKIAESETCFAFLDINPLVKGHTLVIPKREVDQYFDLEADEIADLSVFAKKIAAAIKTAIPCNRVGVSVIGLEVPHAHVHLIPIDSMDDMNFAKEKMKLSQEELAEIATKIRNAVVAS